MKFRKKPVVIEAVQWKGWEPNQDPDVIPMAKLADGRLMPYPQDGKWTPAHAIKTLEGWHEVTDGDWIITGVKGERYPCKPDIFAMTYEPVEAAGFTIA